MMSNSKESTSVEVIKSKPFLIGITIAVFVVIAGIVGLSYLIVTGGNSKKDEGINVENNINVNFGKDNLNGMWPVFCTDLFALFFSKYFIKIQRFWS